MGHVDQNRMTLAIYQGLLGKEPWRDTTCHLAAYMSASAIIVIRPSTSTDLGFLVCHPQNPEIEHAYRVHYWTLDPFLDLPIDQVLTIDEYLGEERWLNSEFYKTFIGQGGVRHGLGVNIVSKNGTVCRLRLYRLPDQPAFTAQDKTRLGDLVAHFGQALSLAAHLERHETQSELYEGALDRLHIGAIVLDENQHLLRCNQVAKSMLSEGDGIKSVANGVEAHYKYERSMLRELITTAGPAAQVMSISRPSGKRKLGVVIRSIPLREESEGKGRPAWVMFICDPDVQTTAPREILRQVFDFTPAEATLAMELANGLSLDEAAELLGIRRNTARTHLRAIFAKAGVSRQAELVRIVLNGVVGLSSLSPAD
ncbi:helix-turn-helix transcriptional regulator [Pseudomonas sp. MWU13-2105]|uniref:helix-turn-helix transcriptional regulator n=1 Tax=Pseudomonas sp. MWU13-2105 TaxID=2935074 RepID=UPI00200BF3F7|nr:helix-turn-helix transcriptional regulator [Pseudomonas sp. MWU13-2105]